MFLIIIDFHRMTPTRLILTFLLITIALTESAQCPAKESPVQLALLPVKENSNYQYSITNYANHATIIRNENGTFLQGDFSTLKLYTQHKEYQYVSKSLSFKLPPQHRVVETKNQMLQLQIVYELSDNSKTRWKHQRVALSITFVMTEYAPQQLFTLGHQINPNLQNGTQFDLNKLLPLVRNLNMFLYKGTHTAHPQDNGFIWLVRKQLLLMSQLEFQQVKSFIFAHIPQEQVKYEGLSSRDSTINIISEAIPQQTPINDG